MHLFAILQSVASVSGSSLIKVSFRAFEKLVGNLSFVLNVMTDPIADMLTRMRNALAVRKSEVIMPYSRLKAAIADILVREGLVVRAEHLERDFGQLRLVFKYGPDGRPVIHDLQRVSRPGRRVYSAHEEITR